LAQYKDYIQKKCKQIQFAKKNANRDQFCCSLPAQNTPMLSNPENPAKDLNPKTLNQIQIQI